MLRGVRERISLPLVASVARDRGKQLRLATAQLPENFRKTSWFSKRLAPGCRACAWPVNWDTISLMQEKPGEDFYSVEKAAKLLGRTPERIRQMLHAGELQGEHEGEDPHAPWKVYRGPVDARRDRRRG